MNLEKYFSERRKNSVSELIWNMQDKIIKLEKENCNTITRIRTWMDERPRRKANVAFTDGILRQMAYLIEDAEQEIKEKEGCGIGTI